MSDTEARNTLVHNEKAKLAANLFNTIAAGLVVTGVVVPAAGFAYQTNVPQGRFWFILLVLWLAFGAATHQLARRFLGGLKP